MLFTFASKIEKSIAQILLLPYKNNNNIKTRKEEEEKNSNLSECDWHLKS